MHPLLHAVASLVPIVGFVRVHRHFDAVNASRFASGRAGPLPSRAFAAAAILAGIAQVAGVSSAGPALLLFGLIAGALLGTVAAVGEHSLSSFDSPIGSPGRVRRLGRAEFAGLLAGALLVGLTLSMTVLAPVVSDTFQSAASRTVTPGKGYGITHENDGGTVTVDADTDIIRLVLDDGVDWSVHYDPSHLQFERSAPIQAVGFRVQGWWFKLLRTGKTQITASGLPECRLATPPCDVAQRTFWVILGTK